MAAARNRTKGREKAEPKGASLDETKGEEAQSATAVVAMEDPDDELEEFEDDGLEEDDGLGDDGDELDEAFDDDAPISPIDEIDYQLRQALEAGQGSPWRICVRELRKPGQPGANLRPVKGYLDLAALSSAGSLTEAVRRKVAEPGEYVVQLEDPVNKKRAKWARYVTIQPDEGSQEVRDVEVARERTIARKKLLEAEAELAKAEQDLVHVRNGSTGGDRMTAVLEAVEARLQRLEERGGAGAPAWVSTVLGSPLIAKVLSRVLAPPPSPASALAEIVPLMNTVMQASASAQLESVKGENRRTDVLLDHALQMLAAQAGIEPEADDSVLGLASKVLDMVRPPQATPGAPPVQAPPPAAPAPTPAPKAPRRPPTPLSKFVAGALALAQQGIDPEDAVEKLLDRWERVPGLQKRLFLSGNMKAVDRVVSTLPTDLQERLTGFVQGGGQAWVLKLWEVLRAVESAPAEQSDEEEAPKPEPATSAAE